MKSLLKTLRRIERVAYPEEYRQLQDCRSMTDLYEYCETEDIKIVSGSGWYCLLGFHGSAVEIVDFASERPLRGEILRAIADIAAAIPATVTTLTGDFRESTSYRLLQFLTRYKWGVVHASPYWWGGEKFYDVTLQRRE
jgi:hypothetical protein